MIIISETKLYSFLIFHLQLCRTIIHFLENECFCFRMASETAVSYFHNITGDGWLLSWNGNTRINRLAGVLAFDLIKC